MAVKTTNKTAPAKRRGTATKKSVARKRVQSAPSSTGRFVRENAGLLLTLFLAVVVGVTLFAGYRAATASEFFKTSKVDIEGTRRASNQAIETIAVRLSQKTGVWNADLELIQREIERLAWVKTATVSRVLPDILRVRVAERNPVAVVRAENGKLIWVDEDGKMLGVVLQSEKAPPFALLGWNENDSDFARKNNQERLSLYLKLLAEFQTQELANRVIAVDLSDLQETEVLVEKDNTLIHIQIGREDFASRLRLALEVLDQTAQTGDTPLAEIEKIIAHGTRVSLVPRKTALPENRKQKS